MKIIKKETYDYFSQLKPENSVIIISIRENDINKLACNETSLFPLDCSIFQNEVYKKTKYYNIFYINTTFNSSNLTNYLDINNKANISYLKNKYISKHKEIIPPIPDKENMEKSIIIKQNILNTFYFKKVLNLRIPKVYISINLLHPYLRPLENNHWIKNCYYFQILEIFSAIQRKTNDILADALRAGNEISFDYNENYLTINIFCYEDVAFNMVKEIRDIIFHTNWNKTDFLENNAIYKNETIDDFFNFGRHSLLDIGKYYFYAKVKNGLYNKYGFNKTNFQNNYDNYCYKNIRENVKDFNKFIIKGLIYGYYNQSEAEDIAKLFDKDNFEEEKQYIEKLLKNVSNNISVEDFVKWNSEIKELKENDPNNSIIIDNNIIDKLSSNISFRYISVSRHTDFLKNFMKLSLLERMLNNINSNASEYLLNLEMFTYSDIYFGLFLQEPNDINAFPNKKIFIDKLFNWTFEYAKEYYSQPVDNIGNRFYYFQKNFKLVLFKKQVSLQNKAIEELYYSIYNYSVPHPNEVIDGKYNFDSLQKFFENINKNIFFDVNTSIQKK